MGNIILLLLAPGLLFLLVVCIYGLVRVVIPQAIAAAETKKLDEKIEADREEHRKAVKAAKEECEKLAPLIVSETRSFIDKVSRSRSFDTLKRVFLNDGAPLAFTVYDNHIICYDRFGREYKKILFSNCGMPDLSNRHPFSKQIDTCTSWRIIETKQFIETIRIEQRDLFGLRPFETSRWEDDGGRRFHSYHPYIDEREVIGVLLCQSTGQKYTYKNEVSNQCGISFKSATPPPDPWQ